MYPSKASRIPTEDKERLTFVDHAPFQLNNDLFVNEVDQEGFRIDWDSCHYCVHLLNYGIK